MQPSDILQRAPAPGLRGADAFQVDRARSWYDRAFETRAGADRRAQRAGLAMASIYRALLDEIARDGYRVLDRASRCTPLRKLWIATRAAWRG